MNYTDMRQTAGNANSQDERYCSFILCQHIYVSSLITNQQIQQIVQCLFDRLLAHLFPVTMKIKWGSKH